MKAQKEHHSDLGLSGINVESPFYNVILSQKLSACLGTESISCSIVYTFNKIKAQLSTLVLDALKENIFIM